MKWKTHVRKVFKGKEGFSLVEVLWMDALAGALDWSETASIKPMPTVTVGYLVDTSPDSITLVSIVNESHIGHSITIPTGCVVRIVHLERASNT